MSRHTLVLNTIADHITVLALQAFYWTYIEKHPAHVVLSPTTVAEATDILTWAYTDRLLPPEAREKIPPFSQDECHELSAILRSLDGAHTLAVALYVLTS